MYFRIIKSLNLTEKLHVEEDKIVLSMKINKVFLDEVEENKTYCFITPKVTINNCLVNYYLSNIFKVPRLSEELLCLIERCFSAVAESSNFLYLNFILVSKILASSGLNIDSELQVFIAADSWLCHNITERRKYARTIFSKVRLTLLSAPALKLVLEKVSSFSINDEYFRNTKAKMSNRNQLNSTNCNIKRRHCNQTDFDIVVSGGYNYYDDLNEVKHLRANNLSESSSLSRMNEGRSNFGAFCIKGELYVFGGVVSHRRVVTSVEKYSPATNTWERICDMYDDRKHFYACSFMNNVYVIGGLIMSSGSAACASFCTKKLQWKKICEMSESRIEASAAVFEGRIVVSGGYNDGGRTNTVEAYDHVADGWTYMPNMIKGRSYHKSVAVKNKLFVFGGRFENDYEVFDLFTNKFTWLKAYFEDFGNHFSEPDGVIEISSKIFVFCHSGSVYIYDVENDEYLKRTCEATKSLSYFSITKLPITKV